MKSFNDKELLQNPEAWPGGICCMKHRGYGKMLVKDAVRNAFGQFTTNGSGGGPAVIVIDLNSMKKVREEEYATLDDLLKDWMVD
jgi:hypothetical protein